MSRKILGLDIRLTSVWAVMLDHTFKGSSIAARAWAPVPTDKPADEGIPEALAAVIQHLQPATGTVCALGIPACALFFRHLSLPFHDPKKIRQVLPLELEPDLPVPMEELAFDVDIFKGENRHDLLAYVAPKALILKYQKWLDALNLRSVLITPAGYAAARCLIMADPDVAGDGFFIDTDGGCHAIYGICGGKIRLVRTLLAGEAPEAHLSRLKQGLDHIRIAAQDDLGLDFDPAWIVSGDPVSAEFFGLPVRSTAAIRSFPRLTGQSDEAHSLEWDAGTFDTALSLALMETENIRGINFSTARASFRHYWAEYRRPMLVSASFVVFMLITMLVTQIMAVSAKERWVAELDSQIHAIFKATFPEATRVVNPLHQMKVSLQELESGTGGTDFPGHAVKVIDILNTLSRQIPGTMDVRITRLVMGADNVVITGDTDTFNTVNDIKGNLEKSAVFKAVTISSADLEKGGERVRFRLKLDL